MALFASRRRIASDLAARTAFVAGLLLALPSVSPAEPPSGAPAPGTSFVAERPTPAAARIARDVETGGWTLAPLTAMRAAPSLDLDGATALNHSHAGLFEVALAGGGYAMDLQGRLQTFSLARRDARGLTIFGCEGDPISLYRWLLEGPPAVDAHGRPLR